VLKRLYGYFAGYKKHLIISVICVIFESGLEMSIPLLLAQIIDVGVANHDQAYILYKSGEMIGLAVLSLVLGLFYSRYAAMAGQGFGSELRKAQYRKVQEFSYHRDAKRCCKRSSACHSRSRYDDHRGDYDIVALAEVIHGICGFHSGACVAAYTHFEKAQPDIRQNAAHAGSAQFRGTGKPDSNPHSEILCTRRR
jgi:ABC-type multidrug transport system fused ATPase/permease subunit